MLDLTEQQNDVKRRAAALRAQFAQRAASYDRQATLPTANLQELHEVGLMRLLISKKLGGGGIDLVDGSDRLAFYLALEEIASVCASTAHCFQVTNHVGNLIEYFSTDEQARKYLLPTVERGALLAGVGSEEGRVARGFWGFLTTAQRVPGGYRLSGAKTYGTNASGAEWIMLVVMREQGQGPDDVMMVMVPRDAAGMTMDTEWWDPLGMRACVSPRITLADVFVPDEDVLGEPGAFARSGIGARHHLGFAAQYVGMARGMLDFVLSYLPQRKTGDDPHTQRAVGEMFIAVESARHMVHAASNLWDAGDIPRATRYSFAAKHHAVVCAEAVAQLAVHVTGGTSLLGDSALPRMLRDLHVQSTHTHPDTSAQTVGKDLLGVEFDPAQQQINPVVRP